MTYDDLQYKAFLTEYKVLKQVRPNIDKIERFILAIIYTSDDRFARAKVLNKGKIDKFMKKHNRNRAKNAVSHRQRKAENRGENGWKSH